MCVSCRPLCTGRCGTRVHRLQKRKKQKNMYIQPVLLKNPLVHGVLHMLLLDTGNPLLGLDTGVRGTDVFLLEEPLHDPLLLRSVQGTLSCRLLRSVQRLLRSVQGKCSWPASSVPSRFERHPVLGDLPVAAVSARNTFLPVDVVGHV